MKARDSYAKYVSCACAFEGQVKNEECYIVECYIVLSYSFV